MMTKAKLIADQIDDVKIDYVLRIAYRTFYCKNFAENVLKYICFVKT